ncbi:cation diffusion facilitator family transporter [Pseudodonghicola flavimaris]|uniref:Cation diffusion facilitator family transporter n=1 Tax=Pseudodonghicola flavimaris TaxID=3050036 RepID=A0ABT7EZH0_9RHOB|nr:cation diffusion facilitator family transporter [Pseudodonghicola flavimaris]MDK3017743.1 cation diffusion facilitator family transporter [Pseudodonghicola flavimaris]
MSRTTLLALGSLIVGLLVLWIKFIAWQITGSVALLSDALESIVNVATAAAALLAVIYANRPADANHPYGHHKAELFSAVLEGVMIVVAAVFILHEAWDSLFAPRVIQAPLPGLMINGAASLLNAVWAYVLISRGRSLRSPALVADGKHLRTDVVSSIGVAFGVAFAVFTGLPWLDPLMAALVAVNILWAGWGVMRHSVGGLMDEALPEEDLERIRAVIATEATGAYQAHDLRTRQAGSAIFIEFHLVVPGNSTVNAAHEVCDRVEAALESELPGAVITIHVEPEEKAKRSGIVVH